MWVRGLILSFVLGAFSAPIFAVEEAPKAEEAEPDPLVLERDALRKEADGLRGKAESFQKRQHELRVALTDAAKAQRSFAELAMEDEETVALKERLKTLEAEIKQVREALMERVASNPEVKARQARVAEISNAMRELREERSAFENAGTATMRRLKVVEDELAERERERLAAEAAAAADGETPAGTTNGVDSVSDEIRGTGATK